MNYSNISDPPFAVGNSSKLTGWLYDCGERQPDDLKRLPCKKIIRLGKRGKIFGPLGSLAKKYKINARIFIALNHFATLF